jgi:uncharacterized membrane protein YdfJ with MMPL/SSD domain
VVADGPTAAGGGDEGGSAPEGGAAPEQLPEGCGTPTTPLPGQPSGYRPFLGPLCSEDGTAALVLAYVQGDGESATLLDPVAYWRDTVSDPGGGLEVKVTGGAGYAADAIEVFENINGTLLGAATLLVIVLLILIYRSPIFLFIPLGAVVFAEFLSQTLGYLVSELGVTINGQSSSIMSVLVLGTVIVSYAAALGVGYFFFEHVFGFEGSDPSLPLFAFVFLVALGVDYNIFLAARAREEAMEHGTRRGMLRALAVTGGVITSAGIVLAGTFAVLGSLPLVFLAEIGFVVAFGVLLDTFLVRSVLVPAATLLIGPKFWWPSELARRDGA